MQINELREKKYQIIWQKQIENLKIRFFLMTFVQLVNR